MYLILVAIYSSICCATREDRKAELRHNTAPGTGRLVTCGGHITGLGTCSVAYHHLYCCNSCGHKCVWSEDCDSFHLKWFLWLSVFLFNMSRRLNSNIKTEKTDKENVSLHSTEFFKEELRGGGKVFYPTRTLVPNID